MTDRCIRIVEDELILIEMRSAMVEDMGMEVCGGAAAADEAVHLAKLHVPALVLMDVQLKGPKEGVDAAFAIRRLMPTPVLYITGSREPRTIACIETDDPAGVLFKPFQYQEFRRWCAVYWTTPDKGSIGNKCLSTAVRLLDQTNA